MRAEDREGTEASLATLTRVSPPRRAAGLRGLDGVPGSLEGARPELVAGPGRLERGRSRIGAGRQPAAGPPREVGCPAPRRQPAMLTFVRGQGRHSRGQAAVRGGPSPAPAALIVSGSGSGGRRHGLGPGSAWGALAPGTPDLCALAGLVAARRLEARSPCTPPAPTFAAVPSSALLSEICFSIFGGSHTCSPLTDARESDVDAGAL